MRRVVFVLFGLLTTLLVHPVGTAMAAGDGYFVVTQQQNPTFYPRVRDGYKDTTVLRWEVPTNDVDEGTYSVDVLDPDGVSIRTLTGWRDVDTWGSKGTVRWNGRGDGGVKLPTGRYTIRVQADDLDGFAHVLTRDVRVASGTKWFKRTHSTGGHDIDARSRRGNCTIHRAGSFKEAWLDCWGGKHARVGYSFNLPYDLRMRDLNWWVKGQTGCCSPGRVMKSGKRTRPHRLWVNVKVTNWRAYDVHRVGYSYWAKDRV